MPNENDGQPFSVDDIDDAVWGGDAAPDAEETPTPPADEEPAGEDEEEGDGVALPDAAAQPQQNKGPGDLRVALKQERQERQALQAQVNQFLTQQAQQQQAQQQAAYQARLQQDLEQMDPADVPAYLEARNQQQAQQFQQQARQQQARQVLANFEDMARSTLPDYDEQITKLTKTPIGQSIANWALEQPNPGQAAKSLYELAKGLRTEAEFNSAVEDAVTERIAAWQGRTTKSAKTPAPTPRLGALPAASSPKQPNSQMSKLSKGLAAPVGSPAWHDAVNSAFEMSS